MTRTSVDRPLGTLALAEQAVGVLRAMPVRLLAPYYAGAVPFVTGFLFFWADMSKSAFAPDHVSAAALGLALLFVWMKVWQVVFCRRALAGLTDAPDPHWDFSTTFRVAANQSLIQATGWILLPLGTVIVLPFGWWFAFYQNASVLDAPGQGLRDLVGRAWHEARRWPEQNHLLITLASGLALFFLANLAVAIGAAPYLLKKLLGIDTPLTQSHWWMVNSTFIMTLTALTYLGIDPFIKTIYVLRCFYGDARRTGADLRTGLIRAAARSGALILGLAALLLISPAAHAAPGSPKAPAAGVSAADLNRAIDAVMHQPHFAWRMPRAKTTGGKAAAAPGWLDSFFNWAGKTLKRIFQPVGRWIRRFFKWLSKHSPSPPTAKSPVSGRWIDLARWLAMAAIAILIPVAALFLWRRRRRKPVPVPAAAEAVIPSVTDIEKDRVRADDLPSDQWLSLADRFGSEGNWRLAMRARFLAVLACLAGKDLVTIAAFKSNREYVREVDRRSGHATELCATFSAMAAALDRAWYGMMPVKADDAGRFTGRQERIFSLV